MLVLLCIHICCCCFVARLLRRYVLHPESGHRYDAESFPHLRWEWAIVGKKSDTKSAHTHTHTNIKYKNDFNCHENACERICHVHWEHGRISFDFFILLRILFIRNENDPIRQDTCEVNWKLGWQCEEKLCARLFPNNGIDATPLFSHFPCNACKQCQIDCDYSVSFTATLRNSISIACGFISFEQLDIRCNNQHNLWNNVCT